VVICAHRASQAVITSDPADLRQLDPSLRLIALRRMAGGGSPLGEGDRHPQVDQLSRPV
jgi:hypothetical protein